MREIRFVLVMAAGCAAIIAACSSFEGAPPAEGAPDAASDGPAVTEDADRPTEEAGLDAGVDADAGTDLDMVAISVGGKSFLIDRTEVTFGAYSDLVNAVTNGLDAGINGIAGCSYKTDVALYQPCASQAKTGLTYPVTCVDWCEAKAYCAYRGKHLCGALNDGGTVETGEAQLPTKSQWVRACSNDILANGYPYGPMIDPDACGVSDNSTDAGKTVQPVQSFPRCEGGVPGLFDMSGNVEEWIDSCSGVANGPSDTCGVVGGGYVSSAQPCNHIIFAGRGDPRPYRGFRCCKEVP